MTKKTYSDKLKDPRWQKKRLEIFDRDSFCCQHCFKDDQTLHVHHKKYEPGKEPWEVDNDYLITLCEKCHEYETKHFEKSLKELEDILRKNVSSRGLFAIMNAFGNTNFEYSPIVYAEVADFVFHTEYFEPLLRRMEEAGFPYDYEQPDLILKRRKKMAD